MLNKLDKKQKLLAVVLVLTLSAAGWLASQEASDEPEVVEVKSKRPQAPKPPPSKLAPLPVLAVSDAVEELGGTNLFKAQRKLAVLTPAAKAAQEQAAQEAAAPPQAPPLPFAYMGTVEDDGNTVIFLSKEQRLYTVKVGDTFDSQYLLASEDKQSLQFIYLPLNIKQTLIKAGAS